MGRALAGRVLAGGHRVTVWNRTPGRAGDLAASEALTVADAVRGADVVITMLANDDAVRAVALGELRPAIGPGSVYVDCSTVSPDCSAALAEAFPGRFLAAPVLGLPAVVAGGSAVLLAGGDDTLIDRVDPVLLAISGDVRRYATARLALAAKLATNLLLVSEVVALAESFAVGQAGGLGGAAARPAR